MTIIHQGRFTSTGRKKVLRMRSDTDWLRVINYTVADADQTTANGVEYYWQKGFPKDAGWQIRKSNATNASNLIRRINSGFVDLNSSDRRILGDGIEVLGITNATIPVVSHFDFDPPGNPPINPGDYVMLYNVPGARHLSNIVFSVGISTITDTTFSLDYAPTLSNAVSGGSFRRVQFTPLYDPHQQIITKISQAQQGVVTFADSHKNSVGEKVRFVIPQIYGMTGLDGIDTEITAVNTTNNTVTIDVDTRSFRAFTFPGDSDYPFSNAQMIVYGRPSNEENANKLDAATDNDAFLGIELQAGTNSPAGSNGDVIYWCAGKSMFVENN